MKIAIIINTSWNIYNFRRGLVHHFLGRGDRVVAIAPEDAYSHELKQWGCIYHHLEMSGSGMNPVEDLKLAVRLGRILRKEKPDIVLTYTIKPNIYGSIVSGLLRIPCICNVSGLGTVFLWKGYVKKLAVALYTFAFRYNRWIFFQNDEDRAQFLELIRISPDKTSLVPGSGIDLTHFRPVPYRPVPEVSFLMIARLIVEKGVYEYIEAVRILKRKGVRARFRLAGGLDQEHRRAIKKAELDGWIEEGVVTWPGHVDDIRPEIEKAEVVVLPSYREGTPRTLLEAGAMSRAIITTDVAGCRHVVKDGFNGFLCRAKDSAGLAAAMERYLALGGAERAAMGRNSRKWIAENFDEKLVIEQYLNKIDKIIGG